MSYKFEFKTQPCAYPPPAIKSPGHRAVSLFLVFCMLFFDHLIYVNTYADTINSADTSSNSMVPNLVYYDANNVTINKNTGYFELEGNATLLIGNLYLSAKKIVILQNESLITAEGDVKLIYDKEKGTASKVVLDASTKQLRMDNATIFSDPTSIDNKINKEVLGLSKAEIAFDKNKTIRATEIELQLKTIRNEYTNLKNLKGIKRNDQAIDEKIKTFIVRYGQLLARYARTQYQPNAYLAAIPEREKSQFLKRRDYLAQFNKDNPNIVNQIINFSPISSYINVAASQIIQKDNQTFVLNNAIITPCHCSSYGEPPIYGFSAQKAKIDVGNYITLQGATFDVFSLPLIYAPWFKLSIKNKRETGFLYPGAYTSNNAGSAMSVPFFVVLGKHADSTITYRNFSVRGSQFETEFRAQLNEEIQDPTQTTQFYSLSQYIQDKKYSSDWNANNTKINAAIVQDPSKESQYESYRGKNLSDRWYTQESINVPLSYRSSVKVNGQFVSDNTYLSDFSPNSILDPTTVVKGDTTPSSRRFLSQELDTEYYGDNVIFSVRTQGQQDLFSQAQTNTPMRLPRVEYTLLPDRYLNSPFIFSNNTTWENVTKPGGGAVFITPTSLPNSTSIQKKPTDPYVEGKRLFTTSTISLPLPANDYINAYASAIATGVQYYFPAADPYGAMKPYQGYMQYVLNADVPIYGRFDIKDAESKAIGSVTQTFDPYVNFTYIPNVKRSYNFPTTYTQWYAQDSTTATILSAVGANATSAPIATSAILTVGASTAWRVKKQTYSQAQNLINRFLQNKEPSVANLDYFLAAVKEKNLNVANQPDSIFQFSSEIEANKVFESWAKKELESYYQQVLLDELNQKYTWPSKTPYALSSDLDITPITIGISTNYNFLAQKTADEINQNAGPAVAAVPVTPFGDITGTLGWDLRPFVVLNGNVSVAWSQVYSRFNSTSTAFSTTLPYQIGLSYTHALQYVINPNSPSQSFIEKTQDYAGVTYTPLAWMTYSFQWSYSVDPSASPADTSNGRGYASVYSVTLKGIQNCMDIIITRNKPAGTPENQSTYAIGLNLQIFGFPTGAQNVGDYFNRQMQN